MLDETPIRGSNSYARRQMKLNSSTVSTSSQMKPPSIIRYLSIMYHVAHLLSHKVKVEVRKAEWSLDASVAFQTARSILVALAQDATLGRAYGDIHPKLIPPSPTAARYTDLTDGSNHELKTQRRRLTCPIPRSMGEPTSRGDALAR